MPVDKLNLMLMEELEDNPRQSVRALAQKLGMKRTTVRNRLNGLRSEGVLTITCVVNTELMGYQFQLVIGIKTSPGKIATVSDQLSSLQPIQVLYLTTGRYSIMAWALLRDRSALAHFVSEDLAGIADIAAIEIMHSFQWMKNPWRYFRPQMEPFDESPRGNLTDLDRSVIKAIQSDPRQSITNLAKVIGCSRPMAKARLDRLLTNGFIRFVTFVDPKALGYDTRVVFLIKSKPDKTYAVANELMEQQNKVRYMSLLTGQWQLLVGAHFEHSEYMHNFVLETLTSIPGITEFEVVHIVKTLKYSPLSLVAPA